MGGCGECEGSRWYLLCLRSNTDNQIKLQLNQHDYKATVSGIHFPLTWPGKGLQGLQGRVGSISVAQTQLSPQQHSWLLRWTVTTITDFRLTVKEWMDGWRHLNSHVTFIWWHRTLRRREAHLAWLHDTRWRETRLHRQLWSDVSDCCS